MSFLTVLKPLKKGIPEGNSIFLAGPSFREPVPFCQTWRAEAIGWLNSHAYTGSVSVPEPFDPSGTFEDQVKWEEEHLEAATCILFWVPRNLLRLPGFTTNVEFGEWMKSGKVVLGFPGNAQKMRYLEYKAKEYSIPVAHTLEETVDLALEYLQVRDEQCPQCGAYNPGKKRSKRSYDCMDCGFSRD